MSRIRRLAAVTIVLSMMAVLPWAGASAQAPSGPPAFWGGTAWLDGELAPPGTPVVAMSGSRELGRGEVGDAGRFEPFRISAPPGGDRTVSFTVDGAAAAAH